MQNAPYYEIKMAYVKLEFGKWTAKKVLDETMLAGHLAGKGCFNNLKYKLGVDDDGKEIKNDYNSGNPYEIEYLGHLVWNNNVFEDYSKVTLKK